MFDKARERLYEETDIVSILKQLRLNAFLTKRHLKPHHYALSSWFDTHCIHEPGDEDSNNEEILTASENIPEEPSQRGL